MNQVQSYFDLYEFFSQIKSRYNLQSHLDWVGKTINNYKFLNLCQQYISVDQWKKSSKIVISQHSNEINSFIKNLKSKIIITDFDPHNQISGFCQLVVTLNWVNAKSQNNYIELTDSFRIIESLIGQETINLICCTTQSIGIGICFIPITQEVTKFLLQYGYNLSKLDFFDLMQIIHLLKAYIKRHQATKINKSKNTVYIQQMEITTANGDTCLNGLKTQFSGSPFTIINTQQTNTLLISEEGIFINHIPPQNFINEKERAIDNKFDESCYVIDNNYIMWIEDISMINNIVLACYVNL